MEIQLLVNIDVPHLEKAVEFYRRGLGLRLVRRLFGTVAEMSGASCTIYLLEKPPGSLPAVSTPQRRDYQRHWTPVHLDFVVDNIHWAVERAQAAGATLEGPTQTYTWGRLANMADPFGHGFCFIEFLGRGYDETA